MISKSARGKQSWIDMAKLSFWQRIAILIGLLVAGLLVVLLALDPIPQDPDYHLFADSRPFLGIPNFNNVVSNAGFAVVGVLGVLTVAGWRHRHIFAQRSDARPYLVFFAGVALVSLGVRLLSLGAVERSAALGPLAHVDRILCSAVIADRIDSKAAMAGSCRS